jgi:hypothetical protein
VTFRGFEYRRFKKFGKRPKAFKVLRPFGDDLEPVDTILTEITNALGGDERTAKRVRALQVDYPNGTLPELVTMDWLDVNKYRYIYQGRLFGGRAAAGGLLPDFVVDTGGGRGAAWQVQGEYWHNKSAEKGFSDTVGNLRLLGQVVGGIRIDKVTLLNERDILRRRPFVFQMAIAGIAIN